MSPDDLAQIEREIANHDWISLGGTTAQYVFMRKLQNVPLKDLIPLLVRYVPANELQAVLFRLTILGRESE